MDNKTKQTIAAVLKTAIERSGLTVYRIGKASGFSVPALGRFLRGGVPIRLGNADRLASCLGLRLVLTRNGKPLGLTLTDSLRTAIRESGLTCYRIAKDTGIDKATLSRFLRGSVSPQLDVADRLAAYLGLHLVPDPDAKPPDPTPANLARPTLAKRKAKRCKAKDDLV
jgi:transcriptional regulator with XRE-family HTH domain